MGGLPCYKSIIDQRNALIQAMACMEASLTGALSKGVEPTYEEQEEFQTQAEKMARCAAKIERRVREDAGF